MIFAFFRSCPRRIFRIRQFIGLKFARIDSVVCLSAYSTYTTNYSCRFLLIRLYSLSLFSAQSGQWHHGASDDVINGVRVHPQWRHDPANVMGASSSDVMVQPMTLWYNRTNHRSGPSFISSLVRLMPDTPIYPSYVLYNLSMRFFPLFFPNILCT